MSLPESSKADLGTGAEERREEKRKRNTQIQKSGDQNPKSLRDLTGSVVSSPASSQADTAGGMLSLKRCDTTGPRPSKPLSINKRTSIRMVAPEITRGQKNALIDAKIVEFEDNVIEIGAHLRLLQQQIDEKPDMEHFNNLREDKLAIADIYNYIPNQEQTNQNMEAIVK